MSVTHVYRWDLDKTYLATDFGSLRGLARTALEPARDKENIPGSAALLRHLGRATGNREPWIAIVSGSPRQMRSRLEEKLRLDGVRWDEFHLKDQWGALKRGRFRAVKEQLGYKLPLLLRSRRDLPAEAREVLFGDDAEMDALVYSLFAELLEGRMTAPELVRVMEAAGAYEDTIEESVRLLDGLRPTSAVEFVFVHLDKPSPPARFRPLGTRVVPIASYVQAALVLYDHKHLLPEAVLQVAQEVLRHPRSVRRRLSFDCQDIVRRGYLRAEALERLSELANSDEVPDEMRPGEDLRRELAEAQVLCRDLGPRPRYQPSAPPTTADWIALARHWAHRD